MDAIEKLIERLQATAGDTQAQAAVAAEFALTTRPEAEREPLREALDAAAVLRWFDASLLAKVLAIPEADGRQRFAALLAQPFVETNRDRHNVHESTRLGWRKRLAQTQPARFQALSLQAAAGFAEDPSPQGRIEWIYHLLGGDPERGATELEKLGGEWTGQAYPEHRYALAVALRELEDTRLVEGRARAWTLLAIAWVRVGRGETAQLADMTQEVLWLARQCHDSRAEAEAQGLIGDVAQAQGRLEQAQAAYAEALAISRRLAESDPANAGWQRVLAVAHSKLGDVAQAQGRLEQAQAAYAEYLAISRRLAESAPSNAGWQRDLAVAHSKLGDILWAQGRREQAQAAYAEYLAISRRLAESDPSNAGWQRGLAVAHSKVGDVAQAQGRREQAQAAYAECLAISRRLAESDPSNAGWQRDLALACVRNARIKAQTGKPPDALPLYEEAARIYAGLVEHASGFVEWAEEWKMLKSELKHCRFLITKPERDFLGLKSKIGGFRR